MLDKNKEFSERLKKARIEAGLSQQDLANALKVTRATVSRYENGERMPTINKLKHFQYAGINYIYVITGQEPMLIPIVSTPDEPPALIFAEFRIDKKFKKDANNAIKKLEKIFKKHIDDDKEFSSFLNEFESFIDSYSQLLKK